MGKLYLCLIALFKYQLDVFKNSMSVKSIQSAACLSLPVVSMLMKLTVNKDAGKVQDSRGETNININKPFNAAHKEKVSF